MTRTRVVVTGLGATTPLGGDVATTWEAMLAGASGISRIEADWADDLAVKIAGPAAVDPATVLDRVEHLGSPAGRHVRDLPVGGRLG